MSPLTEDKRKRRAMVDKADHTESSSVHSASETVKYLAPMLIQTLGQLYGAPGGVAETALLTLPYEGSLKTLDDLGVVELQRDALEKPGSRLFGSGRSNAQDADLLELSLTDLGRKVIELSSELVADEEVELLSGANDYLPSLDEIQLALKKA